MNEKNQMSKTDPPDSQFLHSIFGYQVRRFNLFDFCDLKTSKNDGV